MRAPFHTVVAAVLLLILMPPLGHAHEADSGWSYPWECCSSMDCSEIGTGQPEPDPVRSPGGWQLSDGTVVPFHLARSSPDGRFHVCRRGGQSKGPVIRPHERPACLWVPSEG
jgi:hypothetical protein